MACGPPAHHIILDAISPIILLQSCHWECLWRVGLRRSASGRQMQQADVRLWRVLAVCGPAAFGVRQAIADVYLVARRPELCLERKFVETNATSQSTYCGHCG